MKPRLALLLVAVLAALTSIATTSAPPVAFFQSQSAEARLGEPITFSARFTAVDTPARVELLLRLPDQQALTVLPATVSGSGGSWTATATLEGQTPPNTTLVYRFRVRDPVSGDVLGPDGRVTVIDARFTWRTLEGDVVRLHWYEGDQAFAERALQIGEDGVQRARDLLGVTEFPPVDFFIYADEADFRAALGPGTRENVGGQAHTNIRTMFGLIEPHEINSDWVDTLVVHELTHLVFNSATSNPFHAPPRWLNEGVATYLSEGNSPSRRAVVEQAVERGELIPIDGLAGLFPTTFNEFLLAYGESVSAVDFFVQTYGEEKLWALVRSYAEGVSDDEAFTTATGADVAAFNADWMESLGVEVPLPFGPRPGPLGPVPADWNVAPTPTPGPDDTPVVPRPTATPDGTPGVPGNDVERLALTVGFVVVGLLLAGVLLALLIARRNSRRPPPGAWPPGSWPPGSWPPGSWPPPGSPPP